MSDIIEELIELLNGGELEANKMCITQPDCDKCPHKKSGCQERTVAEYLLANGVTVQEWVPVSERLPEDEDQLHFYDDGRMRCITVLAYTEYGRTIPKNRLLVRPTGNEFLDKQVTDGWIWASGTEKVTHWMPLPEPPKGE